jgi:hypothetical protein
MGKKKCVPCQPVNCNPQSYYCTYPNNSLCSNISSNIFINIIDFSNEINGNHEIINYEKNVLPAGIPPIATTSFNFKTSSVGIYVNGCPGSTLDSFFINYNNYFMNNMTPIPYGNPNNFLGNSLPYYSWGGTGLTNSGGVIVMSNNQYILNNTFRVIVNAVNTTTNVTITDGDTVITENYKDTIVRTYYADFYCNEIQNGFNVSFNSSPISTLILRLNETTPPPNLIYKTAILKNLFYSFGTNQSNTPTGTETSQQYLTKLINKDNDLNLQVALDAIKW